MTTTIHKSENMAAIAEQNGWQTQIKTDMSEFEKTGNLDDIKWILFAIRGDDKKETLRLEWIGDLQGECLYRYGDYTLRPARKAPVLKLLQGKPDPRKYKREEKRDEPATIEEKLANKNVPWEDDNESPAFDILVGVVGKTITWISSITGIENAEFCPKESNLRKAHFKVKTTSAGKRVLEWANPTGFHACYVTDIIDVT